MRKLTPILLAGLVTGALDILAAFASYATQGFKWDGILKYIAAGLVGPGAMQGGVEMVALGLFCHFALTTGMAAIFLFAALRVGALTARPWLWGTVYGFLTWVGMVRACQRHGNGPRRPVTRVQSRRIAGPHSRAGQRCNAEWPLVPGLPEGL